AFQLEMCVQTGTLCLAWRECRARKERIGGAVEWSVFGRKFRRHFAFRKAACARHVATWHVAASGGGTGAVRSACSILQWRASPFLVALLGDNRTRSGGNEPVLTAILMATRSAVCIANARLLLP